MSIRTLKNWEAEGKLHPRLDRREMTNGTFREVVVYDPDEVAEIAAKRAPLIRARLSPRESEGELAARAFEYYGEGLSVVDVVTRLRITPRVADELREQWERMGGVEMVLHPAAREQLTQLLGPFDGVADLVSRVRARLAPPGSSREADADPEKSRGSSPPAVDVDTRAEASSTGERPDDEER